MHIRLTLALHDGADNDTTTELATRYRHNVIEALEEVFPGASVDVEWHRPSENDRGTSFNVSGVKWDDAFNDTIATICQSAWDQACKGR